MAVRVTIRNIEAIGATKERVRQVIFAGILDLDADLRNATPVDTGFAVNSWFAQANGAPPAGEGFESKARGASDPATIFAGVGGVVSLVNTAEYINKLNEGHSAQAPAGFVEAAANRLQDHIDRHVMLSEGS